ncbi:thiol:disulfide interchange protein [Gluconobacter albidus]|uniref:thiol:disulfide interchange protein n=1 Tax=Gluconobacter albidus TaxID=318683 RepID=UPI001B8AA1DB|nr:thiol:disulfide interchange protein [Gluconobacter albidus]MBS1029107.1 thiol:disulfide interchange protein [Gluconobacter albidus]
MRSRTSLYLAGSLFLAAPAMAQTQCAVPSSPAQTSVHQKTASLGPQPTDAIQRLVQAGSEILWAEPQHGLQTGVAHGDNQLLVFFTPENHSFIIGGTLIPVPYDRLHELMGKRATDLEVWHGTRGMFVRNGDRFQVVYATPDGQAAIAGTVWDTAGKNITRQQIRYILGAVPTVRIDVPGGGKASAGSLSEQIYAGVIGQKAAPEVIMFIDPRCTFSIRAMQLLQPAVDSGKLRLRVVPLSLLDYEDGGASTRYAKAMTSLPADASMVQAWTSGGLSNVLDQPSPEAQSRLDANMAAAKAVSLTGTPTFFWKHHDGSLGRLDGMPPDLNKFLMDVSQ